MRAIEATTDEPTAAPVNILLVDDRPSNLLALQRVLDRPDYNLVSAGSGAEGLNHLLRNDFAVILLDVAMPDMDGFETATLIRQRERSRLVPIIFVTASAYEMEHVFHGYTVGAVDYLRKPVDPHALRSKVAVFVELHRQREQIERQAVQLREAELREQQLLRERAERALRQSETIYQLTFDDTPVGIGHADADGRWLKVNQRLHEMLATDQAGIIGSSLDAMAEGDDAQALRSALQRLNAGEIDLYTAEHRLTSCGGRQCWGQIRTVAVPAGPEAPVRYIIVIDDVSERKQLELDRAKLVQELQAGIRARDEFLSIASHELKTPVTPLRLLTESILRAAGSESEWSPDEERLFRRLQIIDKSASRLEALVDRLLDVSSISAGKLTLQHEEVDLSVLVRESIDRLSQDEAAGVPKITLDAPIPVVGHWDRVRLEQIFMNLVQNALRYGAGKPVHVSVGAGSGIGRLTVRDHGAGIPPQAQERIFERFERVAPMRHFGGFGLGLWIVRQLVEAHGGRISIKSKLDQGSEFTVELPLDVGGARSDRQEAPVEAAQAKENDV